MNSLISLLLEKKQELSLIKRNILANKKDIPEGRIRISTGGNRTRYYWITPEWGKRIPGGRVLKKEEYKIAKQIIQNDYDKKILVEVNRELDLIEQVLNQYNGNEFEEIFDKLHCKRQELIIPSVLDSRHYSEIWGKTEYQGKNFSPDTPEIYTDRGERVRSKSEKIIADKLYAKGIPYQYEYPIELGSWGIVYPDFRVLNVRERKTLYWEHLGMMGQPDYVENAVMKINKYIKCGIYPGEQLILTYETASHPIDTKTVDLLINKYLL